MRWYGLNRSICEVFGDMKSTFENGDPGSKLMRSLIEEAHILAKRMEAGLQNQHDIEDMHTEIKKLKEQLKKLKAEKQKLKPDDSDDSC